MSHYEIEGSGRVKEDPLVSATHPKQAPSEYIGRTKVEEVIKIQQVEELISKAQRKTTWGERRKDICSRRQ